MKKTIALYVTAVGTVLASAVPALAVPVVPNFTQGSMTSHTETTSTVTETINSIDYNTGWQYSVTGTGISHNGSSLLPDATVTAGSVDVLGSATDTTPQTTSQLDLSTLGDYTITTPGGAFQLTTTYMGPGISNQTIIQRTTNVTSVTDTTSIFSQ